jgi:tetratricopeptide (TPR) repeat protein
MPRSLTTHIDSPKELGLRLREARERAGLSQRQLSFPGCTAAYISRLEAGARVPSLQMVNQLASRLGVSGQWLATGVDDVAAPGELLDAEVALRLGETEEAERIYRAHLETGSPARPAALAGLGQIAFRAERWHDAIELFEQALALRRGDTLCDPGLVDSLGRALAITGDRSAAIALFERAAREASEAGASVEELRFNVLLANALIDASDFARAESVLGSVLGSAQKAGDPVATARVYWSQSRLHSLRHEPALASRYARRALEILERTENDAYVGMAHHLLAYAEIEAGHGDEALLLLERGRALFGGDLGPRDDARFAVEEARALTVAGRNAEAARRAAHALQLLDVVSPDERSRAYLALANVFAKAEDADRAKMLLGQALELASEHAPVIVLEIARSLAELLEAEGDTDGALQVLKRAADVAAGARPTERV